MVEDVVNNLALTETEIIAGREYLTALRRLRFEPDALCWITRREEFQDDSNQAFRQKELALVTSFVDRFGSRVIYDLLFKAYDISVTPKEIDPFTLGLYGSKTIIGQEIVGILSNNGVRSDIKNSLESMQSKEEAVMILTPAADPLNSFIVYSEGVYVVRMKPFDQTREATRFHRFKNEINSLAA
jgi:hypothetical protein